MCRSGPNHRRCPSGDQHGRTTAAARKRRSRARADLRKARAAGDAAAEQAARERLDQANAELATHRQNRSTTVPNDSTDQQRPADGANSAEFDARVIDGDVTVDGRKVTIRGTASTAARDGDVTPSRQDGTYRMVNLRGDRNVGMRADVITGNVTFGRPATGTEQSNTAEHRRDVTNSRTRGGVQVGGNNTTSDDSTSVQIGHADGGVWINGRRIS